MECSQSYLLAEEDISGVKSEKAKDLGVTFSPQDGLFGFIPKSKPAKAPVDKYQSNNNSDKLQQSQTNNSPAKVGKTMCTATLLMIRYLDSLPWSHAQHNLLHNLVMIIVASILLPKT
ncbi:hypothetical protein BDA96_09G076600 [Sorghum bicolor]|uniref:Uncharacterized protein n=2 Tax=Sorghum bicolor TaxID=4558 RepID=A0A921Q8N5_SORBI|nr:hypothetical protein BDA96_09G076600 [Sorghum bicolor]OQU77590.1 hypothetical protein SORBI_3009G072333 [Sorghum bicolor]